MVLKHLFLLALLALSSHGLSAKERIVVAGGSLTEIIYALGAEDLLVGVDSSSHYPMQVRKLPDVGYYRTLNVEGLLSVSPSLVVLLQGAGPKEVIGQLESLGVETVIIDNHKSVDGLLTMINDVAQVTGKQSEGKALLDSVKTKMSSLAQQPKLGEKSAVFLMSAGERGLVAAGKNTTPQLIFDTLSISNPYTSLDGYKPISSEALAVQSPDLILVASHTTRGLSVESLCQSNQLRLWASQQGCNLVKVDSLKYLGLTPRLPQAIAETRELLSTL